MPSVSGRAPPESEVPAPRGTTLTFSASQKRRMRCHLLGGGRQDHGHGHGAVGGEPVALVGAQLLLGRDHALAGHDLAQGRDDRARAWPAPRRPARASAWRGSLVAGWSMGRAEGAVNAGGLPSQPTVGMVPAVDAMAGNQTTGRTDAHQESHAGRRGRARAAGAGDGGRGGERASRRRGHALPAGCQRRPADRRPRCCRPAGRVSGRRSTRPIRRNCGGWRSTTTTGRWSTPAGAAATAPSTGRRWTPRPKRARTARSTAGSI